MQHFWAPAAWRSLQNTRRWHLTPARQHRPVTHQHHHRLPSASTITHRHLRVDIHQHAVQTTLDRLFSFQVNFISLLYFVSVSTVESLAILTAIFPGETGLAGFIAAKDAGSGGDTWSHKTCKTPAKLSPLTAQYFFISYIPSAVRSRSCTVSLWGPEVWPCNAPAPGTPLVVCSGSDHVQSGYTGIPVYARPRSGLPCWDS